MVNKKTEKGKNLYDFERAIMKYIDTQGFVSRSQVRRLRTQCHVDDPLYNSKKESANILDWAENEVKLAIEKEKNLVCDDGSDDIFNDYAEGCYDSALNAFCGLVADNHSGFSIQLTQNILNRLIATKPLTSVQDSEDDWKLSMTDGDCKFFQHKRCFSLFKQVYDDGTVNYRDSDRIQCIDIDEQVPSHFGFVMQIVDEMRPIKFPYFPGSEPEYRVYFSVFEYSEEKRKRINSGRFNTLAVYYFTDCEGRKYDVERYFKLVGNPENELFEEISKDEYYMRAGVAND